MPTYNITAENNEYSVSLSRIGARGPSGAAFHVVETTAFLRADNDAFGNNGDSAFNNETATVWTKANNVWEDQMITFNVTADEQGGIAWLATRVYQPGSIVSYRDSTNDPFELFIRIGNTGAAVATDPPDDTTNWRRLNVDTAVHALPMSRPDGITDTAFELRPGDYFSQGGINYQWIGLSGTTLTSRSVNYNLSTDPNAPTLGSLLDDAFLLSPFSVTLSSVTDTPFIDNDRTDTAPSRRLVNSALTNIAAELGTTVREWIADSDYVAGSLVFYVASADANPQLWLVGDTALSDVSGTPTEYLAANPSSITRVSQLGDHVPFFVAGTTYAINDLVAFTVPADTIAPGQPPADVTSLARYTGAVTGGTMPAESPFLSGETEANVGSRDWAVPSGQFANFNVSLSYSVNAVVEFERQIFRARRDVIRPLGLPQDNPMSNDDWELIADAAVVPWRNSTNYLEGQIILYSIAADDPATRASGGLYVATADFTSPAIGFSTTNLIPITLADSSFTGRAFDTRGFYEAGDLVTVNVDRVEQLWVLTTGVLSGFETPLTTAQSPNGADGRWTRVETGGGGIELWQASTAYAVNDVFFTDDSATFPTANQNKIYRVTAAIADTHTTFAAIVVLDPFPLTIIGQDLSRLDSLGNVGITNFAEGQILRITGTDLTDNTPIWMNSDIVAGDIEGLAIEPETIRVGGQDGEFVFIERQENITRGNQIGNQVTGADYTKDLVNNRINVDEIPSGLPIGNNYYLVVDANPDDAELPIGSYLIDYETIIVDGSLQHDFFNIRPVDTATNISGDPIDFTTAAVPSSNFAYTIYSETGRRVLALEDTADGVDIFRVEVNNDVVDFSLAPTHNGQPIGMVRWAASTAYPIGSIFYTAADGDNVDDAYHNRIWRVVGTLDNTHTNFNSIVTPVGPDPIVNELSASATGGGISVFAPSTTYTAGMVFFTTDDRDTYPVEASRNKIYRVVTGFTSAATLTAANITNLALIGDGAGTGSGDFYTISTDTNADDSNNVDIILAGASSTNTDVTLVAGTGITLTASSSAGTIEVASSGGPTPHERLNTSFAVSTSGSAYEGQEFTVFGTASASISNAQGLDTVNEVNIIESSVAISIANRAVTYTAVSNSSDRLQFTILATDAAQTVTITGRYTVRATIGGAEMTTEHNFNTSYVLRPNWRTRVLDTQPTTLPGSTDQGAFEVGDSAQLTGIADGVMYVWVPTNHVSTAQFTTANPNIELEAVNTNVTDGDHTLFNLGSLVSGTQTVRVGRV